MDRSHIKPHNRRNWPAILRSILQSVFVIFILAASIRHNLLEETSVSASIDALCPFGGLETLWQMLTTGGYIPKTHASNIVLGLGLLVGALLSGAAFCGWICPLGSIQDALTWMRKRLKIREIAIPGRIDKWLRYGRFVVLALVLFKTFSTVRLWFAGYDPYRTIFGLGWLFEFNLADQWPAYLAAIIVLTAGFLIPRAWCKYACPLGGALSLLGYFSFLRIRRRTEMCKNCGICNAPCPVGIAVAQANPRVDTNCIGCLACVEACPRHNTLEVQLAPAWWDDLQKVVSKPAQPGKVSGD